MKKIIIIERCNKCLHNDTAFSDVGLVGLPTIVVCNIVIDEDTKRLKKICNVMDSDQLSTDFLGWCPLIKEMKHEKGKD